MLIAVTGGTGYLGAHIVSALLDAGHRVRLLVEPSFRNDELTALLSDRGEVTWLRGDVRDRATVSELLDGCDALLHAAGIVGTDDSRAQLMWEINAYATESILRTAAERGLDPIVSVSSYASLFPPPGPVIGPDTPPADGRSAYGKTKAYADRVARELQRDGAPVVVTYPSSVVGPALATAPGITEQGWQTIVRYRIAPRVRDAGMQMVDVRDIADVHVALMRPGRGPKRYVCGGVFMTFDEMVSAVEAGAGVRIRRVPLSPAVFRAVGRVSDLLAGLAPLGAGFSYEAAQLITAGIPTDDSVTLSELGITWRSPREAIIASFQ
ncbi:polysaccharide biosynthesis family protein [Mycolicibacterium hassiacum DSM 44199]|mgnify:CR=1 FL=1|jgi:nucleoside-diphosphate-sugar epimerase|uniref:Polysaccharide biosynthesis family protein n=1 Tax=Mycolicibacterium hassiacum (strain DSM 44199 / CIP 105218 / JCM 12690 / 3849) TaxID=1122247 RepID=K5BB02_MYCHD|nr:NAD-dependent epimerase/dehydratase family protein [Mycolicibacterium hassiacum]EKF23135.1 polysaccharide biosynthesis family protein [Mycolicibacterium hassiacum DSM 44199]MBX5486545.1 NAD-dependent epimerase/dehydratase family protein [Mycolicibacterium hassiacum]VCT89587.1 3 beta-hydroxysteroid dehydrogenase/Delta 5-->4-isomerase [Mycolicibacterium hassiacum DSM 44199]